MTDEQKPTLETLTRKGRPVYQKLKGDWGPCLRSLFLSVRYR